MVVEEVSPQHENERQCEWGSSMVDPFTKIKKLTTISMFSQPVINFKDSHFAPLMHPDHQDVPDLSLSKLEHELLNDKRPTRSFSFSDENQEVSTASGEDLIQSEPLINEVSGGTGDAVLRRTKSA
jgi:hypothetical protein